MNRKEFQEWLEQFPEDTRIEVIVQEPATSYQSYGPGVPTLFTAEEYDHYDYTDMTGNPFVAEDSPVFNMRTLTIGSYC